MAQAQTLAATGVVVGMKELTGEVGTRMDVDVLLTTQPDTFNLFLQALGVLQKDPSLLGYYALAGIHGLPRDTWDGVNKKFRDAFGGYCAHGVLIFPTWHRPYLSLLEQTIYQKMVEIAQKYDPPHRQRYLDAAKRFRLPYLDYFRPRDGKVTFPGVAGGAMKTSFPYNFRLPDIFNEQKVALKLPPLDTLQTGIDNPLYSYKFSKETGQLPPADQREMNRSFSMVQTVRYPDSLSSTTHNLQELSDALNTGREGRNSLALNLLFSEPYGNLETVASDKLARGDITVFRDDNTRASGNLEGSIHGNYHNLIGGPGHMSHPSIAAFDPVFWFHHCQIDRLWAFWQANHPNAWFPDPIRGQIAENKKDLLPFYKARSGPGNGTFFDSDDAKTTETFGYVYDDFVGLPSSNASKALRTRLENKYTWSSRTPGHPRITDPPADMKPLDVRSTYFFSKTAPKQPQQPLAFTSMANTNGGVAAVGAAVGGALSSIASTAQATIQAVTPHIEQVVLGGGGQDAAPATAAHEAKKIDPIFDREWYVDSIVDRSAANGPFTIFFFLAPHGAIVTDPVHYVQSPYVAGINHIFAAPRECCDNCGDQEAAGQLATDTAPITPLLLDYLDLPDNGLESLRPEHVKPFLVKYLRWRVVYGINEGKDPREVPNLIINVSAKVHHEDGSKTYEVYPEVVDEIIQNASEVAGA